MKAYDKLLYGRRTVSVRAFFVVALVIIGAFLVVPSIIVSEESSDRSAQGRAGEPGRPVSPATAPTGLVPVRIGPEAQEAPMLYEDPIRILELKGQELPPHSGGGTPLEDPFTESFKNPLAPPLGTNFQGIGYTGWIPPDPVMAVGPSHIVECVNLSWAIYSKSGSKLYESTFANWFSNVNPPSSLTDPKVVYDHHAGRWIILLLAWNSSSSYYLISVSQTSSAIGSWWNWKIDAAMDGSTPTNNAADYPGLGFDATTAVYITSNQYDNYLSGSFEYAKMRILYKSQLYSGGALSWWDFWNWTNSDGTKVFTWKPAHTFGNPGREYLLNTKSGGWDKVTLWRLTNPTSPTLTRQATISIGSYSVPPNASQQGGSVLLCTNDCRTQDVMYRGGYLHTAFCVGYNWGSGTMSAIRYLKINTSTNSAVENWTYGASTRHYYFPAAYGRADGSAVIVFNRSSSTEYAGARYVGNFPTDITSASLKAGQGYYTRGSGSCRRWGDYSGIGEDPSDGSMWFCSEYATNANTWGTWVGQVYGGPICQVSPTSLDFGTVCVGDCEDRTFTITNIGGGTLSGTVSEQCAHYSLVGSTTYSLTAGQSKTFTVRFCPTSAGVKTCTVETGNSICSDVSCTGVGDPPPACQVTPTSLDFGTVCVGSSVDKTFTIKNTGGCTLSGSVTESCSHYSIVSGGGSYSLGAGQTRTVTVRFQPTSAGTKTCTIETGNSLCSDVSCTGVGDPPPACQVTPTSLNFDTVCVGSYVDKTFTITNTGGCTLSGTVSETCAHYSLVGSTTYSLTAGQSKTFTVRFEPTSTGVKTCTIETGNNLCSDVSCTGTGDAPECAVSPTDLDFDTVCVGQYKDMCFTITNIGGCTLSGNVSETCPHYSFVSGGGSYNLGAGQSRTVCVSFQPTSAGLKTCTIETGSNLCRDVTCSGIGDPCTTECEVNPTSLDFDTVCVGDSSDRTFTITNTGGGTLSGTVSEACADYSLVGDSTYSLTAGQSDTFTVRFEPSSAGVKTCTVETGNAACMDVSCTGIGKTVPSTPANVTAQCIDGYIHVCWNDVAGELGYYVYRNSSLHDSVGANVTCYDDYNPGSGVWCYQISSYNICGQSPQSDTACASCDTCQYPVCFEFTDNTGESYSIVIDSALLDDLELEDCDEIGVFADTGGGLLCVGASVYHPDDLPIPLTAWKDDSQTDVRDGYTPGDTMYFRVWSRNQDREECALADYSDGVGNGYFEFGVYSQLWLEAPCKCEEIPLHAGWQWISTGVDPNPCEMESTFANCWETLDIVKACDGSFCIPGVGCWIDCWNVCEMYSVHMSEPCTIQVCGTEVHTDTPCPLPQGWNCIAYFPECPLEPGFALASIWDNLDIVKNDDGEFCIPGVGCWIECMEYNEGYKVHLSSADTLVYPTSCPPCPPPFATTDGYHEFVKSTHFRHTERTGESYSIVINSVELNGKHPEVGDEIGIFTPTGLCVGAGVWQGDILGIAVWQDDDRTKAVDGFQPGEQMVFKLWDKSEDKEIELSARYAKGDGLFAGEPFASVELSGDTDISISLQKLEVNQNYPNPFNPATIISFNLPKSSKVSIKIYNLLGQEVRTLADHTMEAGSHTISWDGRDNSGKPVSSGVYFYRINAGEFSIVKKMIFMR